MRWATDETDRLREMTAAGHSYRQIAERLGRSAGSVRTKLYRLRKVDAKQAEAGRAAIDAPGQPETVTVSPGPTLYGDIKKDPPRVDWQPGVDLTQPGIYYDVPFEIYREIAAVNNSSLTPMEKSPAHYRAELARPERTSDTFALGTFLHTAALEPLAIAARYVVMPDFAKDLRRDDGSEYAKPTATTAYKEKVAEFERVNADKSIVSRDWYNRMIGVAGSIRNSTRAQAYLTGPTVRFEVTLVWNDPDTGLLCKCRVDALDESIPRLADFKSTEDAGEDFVWSIAKWRYDRQLAFYGDGYTVLTGQAIERCIVAAEKESPYGVRSAPVLYDTIRTGRIKYRRALDQIAECTAAGTWPNYRDPDGWEMPESRLAPVDLVVGGKTLSI